MKIIEVRAARTQEAVLGHQCDVVEDHCETIVEAKKRARYVLSDEFQRSGEMSEPMGYAQVVVNGECVADYFRKESPVEQFLKIEKEWQAVEKANEV